jgi:quercetin dioxygenase-like cupin family protein
MIARSDFLADEQPYALQPDQGEMLWFFGMLLTFRAGARQSAGEYSLSEQLGPRGLATPLHRQPADRESFYVLEGEMSYWLDDVWLRLGPGGFAHVPPGATHAFRIESDAARWLCLTTPQHEAFFRAAGDPAPERVIPPPAEPDMQRVAAACERYGVELLGPPPAPDH